MRKKECCGFHTINHWSIPRKQDAHFAVSVAGTIDQRNLSQKALNSVSLFAESTDLTFLKATGDATFKCISDWGYLGISTQYKISPTARAADMFQHFSPL
jgi:hypothetical protein